MPDRVMEGIMLLIAVGVLAFSVAYIFLKG